MYVLLRFTYQIAQRVIQAHGTAMRRYTLAHPDLPASVIADRYGVGYQAIGNLRRGSRAPELTGPADQQEVTSCTPQI